MKFNVGDKVRLHWWTDDSFAVVLVGEPDENDHVVVKFEGEYDTWDVDAVRQFVNIRDVWVLVHPVTSMTREWGSREACLTEIQNLRKGDWDGPFVILSCTDNGTVTSAEIVQ